MKPYLIMSLLLLGMSYTHARAQGSYDDDIYYNSSDIEAQKKVEKKMAAEQQNASYDNTSTGNTANSDGSYQSVGHSYESDGDYQDDGGGSNYATSIRRFNYPFYNVGYYSSYYNPYSYNPYWSDPYWGYSPWYRPGFSLSFGSGPYWSSGWGWNSWWGYSSFNSCWSYPYYGSWYGNYYGGYWNGYYDGLYNSGGGYNNYSNSTVYHNVNYGPRSSANSASGMGLRGQQGITGRSSSQLGISNPTGSVSGPREERRIISGGDRSSTGFQPSGNGRGSAVAVPQEADRPRRSYFSSGDVNGGRSQDLRSGDARPNYGGRESSYQSAPRYESSPRYESPRQGRVEMQRSEPSYQPQRSYEAPRMEQRSMPSYQSPRMSAPSPSPRMSMPSAPMHGGGGFGGGRR